MMNEDWELGALFWNLIDRGATEAEAVAKVRDKFLRQICSSNNDTHFFMGTILAHPKSWVVIGTFYPKKTPPKKSADKQSRLFD